MPEMQRTHAHYLDASALAQLATSTNDQQPIREFFREHDHFFATSTALAQALEILRDRRKPQRDSGAGKMYADEYFEAIRRLLVDAWGKHIEQDEMDLDDPALREQVELTAEKYGLSFQDSLQVVLIKKNRSEAKDGASQVMLITGATGALSAAARSEGIPVWNCAEERAPAWVM